MAGTGNNERISDLMIKYLQGELNNAEIRELNNWKAEDPGNAELFDNLLDPRNIQQGVKQMDAVKRAIQDQLTAAGRDYSEKKFVPSVHRIQFLKTTWFRYAAAIILVFGAGSYIWFANYKKTTFVYKKPPTNLNDVAPGGNRAMLTLADGRTIVLDSAANGKLAEQGAANILKLNEGALVYSAESSSTQGNEVLYNTVSTPKGGQYQIVLPDGTRVWLNAASSLRFPAVFTGVTRTVSITGEVYMEVASNKSKPFIVNANGVEVEVLGTSFNINAYQDEDAIKTTLIEGSVRVSKNKNTRLLTPGQQAGIALTASPEIKVRTVDTEHVIAWKNGIFSFEDGAGIQDVMRQLSRWYNIEIVYEKGVPDIRFAGELRRDMSLAGLLRSLEDAEVHFRLEKDRKLIVLP